MIKTGSIFKLFLCVIAAGYAVFIMSFPNTAASLFHNVQPYFFVVVFVAVFVLTFFLLGRLGFPQYPSREQVLKIFFIFVLSLGLVGGVVGFNFSGEVSLSEQRTLNNFPKRLPFHEEFPNEFNAFVDDRVALRADAVKAYAFIQPYMLDRWDLKGNGIQGDDGWLFFNKENDTVANFQGLRDFSQQELEYFKKTVEEVYDFCKAQGIAFVFILTPSKSSIYPEHYPNFIKRLDKPSSFSRINDYLLSNSSAPITDIFDLLIDKKEEYLLYYKEDTHWNSVGSYFAYRQGADRIKDQLPDYKPIEMEDLIRCDAKNTTKDLIAFIGGTTYEYGVTNEFCLKEPVAVNVIQAVDANKHVMGIKETSVKNGKKAMVFHDSYYLAMEKYIEGSFSQVRDVWFYNTSPLAYKDEILEYKPDVIVWQMLERFVPNIMTEGIKYNKP